MHLCAVFSVLDRLKVIARSTVQGLPDLYLAGGRILGNALHRFPDELLAGQAVHIASSLVHLQNSFALGGEDYDGIVCILEQTTEVALRLPQRLLHPSAIR